MTDNTPAATATPAVTGTAAATTPTGGGEAKKEAKPKRPCAFTGCTSAGSKGCGGCGEVAYCGKEHQLAHWGEHKLVCKKKHQTEAAKRAAPSATGVQGMVYYYLEHPLTCLRYPSLML
jgi:hypothetical protein